MKYFKLFIVLVLMASCSTKSKIDELLLSPQDFSGEFKGKKIELITLHNDNIAVQLSNYGARILSLIVPDKDGNYRDVVWGYANITDFINASDQSSGAIVGRYGNRINAGKFTLDSVEYTLPVNSGGNHLLGGDEGFASQVWDIESVSDSSVTMRYFSADMEAGYPGNLTITLTYTLTRECTIELYYTATTDRPTILNPTNHAYFNLNGDTSVINDHELTLAADNFTPTDNTLIPTGEIISLLGTPLDFTTPHTLGERIENEEYEPIKIGHGYNHNMILNSRSIETKQAVLYSPESGIEMTTYTDCPAIQIYTCNYSNEEEIGKRGLKCFRRSAIALEAQNFPDAPNHSNFPSSVLREGEQYTQTTIYSFSVR